jgi:hypothetical protein
MICPRTIAGVGEATAYNISTTFLIVENIQTVILLRKDLEYSSMKSVCGGTLHSKYVINYTLCLLHVTQELTKQAVERNGML